MTRSTDSSHVLKLIPDYALGLLPGDDADWIAAHLSSCGECRQALAAEQNVGRAVKATLSRASTPDRYRLQSLMPASGAKTGAGGRWPLTSPGLAAAAIMLLLVFSTMALLTSQRPGTWSLSPSTVGSTAVVLTDTPTQTATREVTATAESLGATSSPEPIGLSPAAGQASSPPPALVPVPAAPVLD